jgi:hypothetical protein
LCLCICGLTRFLVACRVLAFLPGAHCASLKWLRVVDVWFLATVTTACAKGLVLPQVWNAGDVSPTGRFRRSDSRARQRQSIECAHTLCLRTSATHIAHSVLHFIWCCVIYFRLFVQPWPARKPAAATQPRSKVPKRVLHRGPAPVEAVVTSRHDSTSGGCTFFPRGA